MYQPPVTMATQHPDNAGVPWWKNEAFVTTTEEIDELLLLFRELPVDEYMWDWEGKYVDEAVGEKLFSRSGDFFRKSPLGETLHLTYRIPAYADGRMHRLARAFMNVLTMADLAKDIGLPCPPVTEMFLPLTETAAQPIAVRAAFRETAGYHRSVFHKSKQEENEMLDLFDVTPLVEDVQSLFNIEGIVRPYWESLLKEKSLKERGQRIFLARSDPALNAGIVPAVLAAKVALGAVVKTGNELGFPVHPVIGTGSLPFRGGVHPGSVDRFLQQYAGVRTYSIQSAFRYDYPKDEVAAALTQMKERTLQLDAVIVPDADVAALRGIADAFTAIWKPAIESLADTINAVNAHVPPRRERLQHIGLFGYSRGVGKVRLPRAIGFTASLYSLGIPPELIATGRGLKVVRERGELRMLETYYPTLRDDLREAGYFLNRENLELLSHRNPAFADIAEDVRAIEEIFGMKLGPQTTAHIIHRNLTSSIFHRLQGTVDADAVRQDITQSAVLRKSVG